MKKRPSISFVVIAYNVQQYLTRCLSSLERQTCGDFEVIVVNDASTDESSDIAHSFEARDARFRVIDKQVNQGAHLARKTGCVATNGRYVIFVDGDDEHAPTSVEVLRALAESREFDFLRFGRTCVADGQEDSVNASRDEAHFNSAVSFLGGEDIASAIFKREGKGGTWSVIDVLFDGDFVRGVFASMTDEPIGRTQDAYEMFVLADQAKRALSFQEFRGLVYHLGAGVSGHGSESAQAFLRGQRGMNSSLRAVFDYAATRGEASLALASSYRDLVIDTISSEWTSRLTLEQQADVFGEMVAIWGEDIALKVLLGPLTARITYLLQSDGVANYESDTYWKAWHELLDQFDLASVESKFSKILLKSYRDLQERLEEESRECSSEYEPVEEEHERGLGLFARKAFGRALHR